MTDNKFITHIIGEIAEYAREKGYGIDDTIERMAQNLRDILLVASFEHWGDTND